MTRKKEIEQASNLVFKIRLCPRTAFIRGAEWADRHPKKVLWDAETDKRYDCKWSDWAWKITKWCYIEDVLALE